MNLVFLMGIEFIVRSNVLVSVDEKAFLEPCHVRVVRLEDAVDLLDVLIFELVLLPCNKIDRLLLSSLDLFYFLLVFVPDNVVLLHFLHKNHEFLNVLFRGARLVIYHLV